MLSRFELKKAHFLYKIFYFFKISIVKIKKARFLNKNDRKNINIYLKPNFLFVFSEIIKKTRYSQNFLWTFQWTFWQFWLQYLTSRHFPQKYSAFFAQSPHIDLFGLFSGLKMQRKLIGF